MTKRALPQRTTRGQLPIHLRETPEPPKRERVKLELQPQENQRKQMDNRLRSQQVANLKNYPFCRAVHYFFDLNLFPRVPGHLSYAIDESNALKNSFSNDRNELNAVTYGQVLNRKMFGLPFNPRTEIAVKKQSRFRNICWGYLFDIEDKKYQNDKMLSTLKVVLNKLNKGSSIQSFKKIEMLRKDVELQCIFENIVPKEEKIQIVEQRLEALRKRKHVNYSSWQPDDQLYYYHSLNQKLHNKILDLKQHLTQEYFIKDVLEALTGKSQVTSTLYYYTHEPAISSLNKIEKNIPLNIMHFKGGSKFLKLAGEIVAKRCESLGETTYYEVREAVKGIFGFQICLRPDRNQTYVNYQKMFRKKCEEMNNSSFSAQFKYAGPDLSNYCRNGNISFRNKMHITGRQYHLIIIFYWLCVGLQELSPILKSFPDLLSLISSDYFIKMYSYLVDVTGSAKVGAMCAAIESISDCFSKPDPLGALLVQLNFQYEPVIGVGLVFGQELTSHSQMTGNSFDRDGNMVPSKKLKRDRT